MSKKTHRWVFLKSLFSSYSERLSKSIKYSVLSFWPLLATLSSCVIAKIHVSDGNIIYTFTCIYFAERINSKALLHVNAPLLCGNNATPYILSAIFWISNFSHGIHLNICRQLYMSHAWLPACIHTDHSEKKPLHVNVFLSLCSNGYQFRIYLSW